MKKRDTHTCIGTMKLHPGIIYVKVCFVGCPETLFSFKQFYLLLFPFFAFMTPPL